LHDLPIKTYAGKQVKLILLCIWSQRFLCIWKGYNRFIIRCKS